jgi:hypothetical protein
MFECWFTSTSGMLAIAPPESCQSSGTTKCVHSLDCCANPASLSRRSYRQPTVQSTSVRTQDYSALEHPTNARHITGVKRSAFGRLSGRQRPDADEVEGDERRQRRGNGAPASVSRTTGPLRGTRCASSFSIPYASAPGGKAGAACLRDIPCGNVVSRWTLCAMS